TKVFTDEDLRGQGLDIKKIVSPTSTSAFAPTTYTYTITITNIGTDTSDIERVRDLVTPGFDYVPGSTTGLTTADPAIASDTVAYTLYLNDDAGAPYPWAQTQGTDSAQGTHTPAKGVWEQVPDYWETTSFSEDSLLEANAWKHEQWWYSTKKDNLERWKVQRVRGAVITDLFTSPEGKTKDKEWELEKLIYNPGALSFLAGDKLRLRLEVYSNEDDPADRQFDYRWGGAVQYDSRTNWPGDCGVEYDELTWDIFPVVPIDPGEELTLSFQVTAAKGPGTYYNQAWVTYRASWDSYSQDYEVRTPPTAPITVGAAAGPECGAGLIVTKTVDIEDAEPGVETTFTFTISVENNLSGDFKPRHIRDRLPPGFTYVSGSASDPSINGGGLWLDEPALKWEEDYERWKVWWHIHANATIPAGQTVTQSFQATATLDPGYDYNNAAWVDWKDGNCDSCPPGYDADRTSGDYQLGSGPRAVTIHGPTAYDVQAVSADGTVSSRVLLWDLNGTIDVLSWQEN
ncbi:MAG: hypothetical protein O7D33_09590, partial [Chloroflexi bacterium]|nr:hypothetical protein [Chloroflexota bacterium]